MKDHIIEISVQQNTIISGNLCETVDKSNDFLTLIKISRSRMRVADSNSSDVAIPIDDCLMLDYQMFNRAPGFEVEAKDNTFFGANCPLYS